MSTGVVVGNPKPQSRTLQAAQRVVRDLTGADPDFAVDLADHGASLLDYTDAGVAADVEKVRSASLVVVASPTYKASYTGLLKVFLDRFGAGELASVRAVPLMLGGHWRHALAAEVHLKPVLAELGASCPTQALFLLDSQWSDADALDGWLPTARRQLGLVTS